MPSLDINWSAVTLGGILALAAMTAAVTYYLLERQRIRLHERQLNRQVEQEIVTTPRMSWDGEQYEWTPESMAFLSDQYYGNPAMTAPQPQLLVPPSTVSGPLPVQPLRRPAWQPASPPVQETDDVITRLRASNEEFMARWAIR